MLTIIGDALNIALRRRDHPLPRQDWADRFVPPHRRADADRGERVDYRRDMRW